MDFECGKFGRILTSAQSVSSINNTAEHQMRPIALGRKNWLFFNSDKVGRMAAIMFSVAQLANRHGLNILGSRTNDSNRYC